MDETSKNPTPSNSPEDDARVLTNAHEIQRDKHRMKALRDHHKKLGRSLGVGGRGKRKMRGGRGCAR